MGVAVILGRKQTLSNIHTGSCNNILRNKLRQYKNGAKINLHRTERKFTATTLLFCSITQKICNKNTKGVIKINHASAIWCRKVPVLLIVT